MNSKYTLQELEGFCLDYRENVVRLAQEHAFGVHLGGSLSLAEVLISLYFQVAHIDPIDPYWPKRDRIVLSKGHGNVGLLTAMAMRGFFPFDRFENFNQIGQYFTMHADSHIPGVEHSAGSLGHGLSVSVGMALAARLDQQSWQVYCILGDGESMEGSVWEALMSAGHYQLDNLTAIIDRNKLTQESRTQEVMDLEPLVEKGRAFGWQVTEVDGHNLQELIAAFALPASGKPKLIIAHTRKGRGVPSHEDQIKSHFAHLTPEQASVALEIIAQERARLTKAQSHGK
ncbi:MAG TPA: transketolase [Anaerolineales bacterium]|nr:transketolase [Anaerolineales bacterium]